MCWLYKSKMQMFPSATVSPCTEAAVTQAEEVTCAQKVSAETETILFFRFAPAGHGLFELQRVQADAPVEETLHQRPAFESFQAHPHKNKQRPQICGL